MKTKLGLIGTTICAAALLALPAVAQQRGSYRNGNNQGYNQGYSQQYSAPTYGQQNYGQQNYSRNDQGYGQRYTGSAQAYGGYSSYGSGYGRNQWRDDDHEGRWNRARHERSEHHRRDWDDDWR